MTARRTHISIFGKDYPIPPKGLYAGVPGKGPEGKQCRHKWETPNDQAKGREHSERPA